MLADGTVKTYTYERKPRQPRALTLDRLIREYRSTPEFKVLRPNTLKTYQRAFNLMEPWHETLVESFRRRDVIEMRNVFMDTPALADQVKNVFSILMKFAVVMEYRETNPASGIKNIGKGEHKRWTNEQVAYALKHLPERFRRAVLVGLYTGQRAGDCIRMTWSDYDGAGVLVAQEKTGTKLWVPCHRALRAELDLWRQERTAVTIITDSHGHPYANSGSFSTVFSAAVRGHRPLAGCVFHGLRKTAAAHLAEAGCSTLEIAAITGHKTLQMIELYTREAEQRTRAKAAIIRLENAGRKTTENDGASD